MLGVLLYETPADHGRIKSFMCFMLYGNTRDSHKTIPLERSHEFLGQWQEGGIIGC